MPAMRTPFWPLVTVVCLGTHVALPVLARADARRDQGRDRPPDRSPDLIDPALTRDALGLGLSAAYNAPIADARFGIFRM